MGLSLCRVCNEQVYDERADLELTEYTTIDRAKYKDLLNRCSGFSAQMPNRGLFHGTHAVVGAACNLHRHCKDADDAEAEVQAIQSLLHEHRSKLQRIFKFYR